MFKEIKKNKKLYMLIVEQIESLIEEGTLKVGDRLPSERELSTQFGISRSTVREAITSLEIMGLVEVQPGLGTFISRTKSDENFNISDINLYDGISPTEILEARLLLEPFLARLAAQRATNEDLEEIEKVLKQADKLSENEYAKFEELDGKLHLLIAKAADNEVLYKFTEILTNLRDSKIWGNLKLKSIQKAGKMEAYKKEHRQIFETLRDRDLDKVESIIKDHIIDVKNDLFED